MKLVKEVYHFEQKKEGQEKAYKTRVGAVLQRENGSLVMKVDYFPINNIGQGCWFELYNPYKKDPLVSQTKNEIKPIKEREIDDDEELPF